MQPAVFLYDGHRPLTAMRLRPALDLLAKIQQDNPGFLDKYANNYVVQAGGNAAANTTTTDTKYLGSSWYVNQRLLAVRLHGLKTVEDYVNGVEGGARNSNKRILARIDMCYKYITVLKTVGLCFTEEFEDEFSNYTRQANKHPLVEQYKYRRACPEFKEVLRCALLDFRAETPIAPKFGTIKSWYSHMVMIVLIYGTYLGEESIPEEGVLDEMVKHVIQEHLYLTTSRDIPSSDKGDKPDFRALAAKVARPVTQESNRGNNQDGHRDNKKYQQQSGGKRNRDGNTSFSRSTAQKRVCEDKGLCDRCLKKVHKGFCKEVKWRDSLDD